MSINKIMSKIEALLEWEKIIEEAKDEADTLSNIGHKYILGVS